MIARARLLLVLPLAVIGTLGLGGCKSKGDLVVDEGVGITAVRTRCPAVGIADYTGDVTLFRVPGQTTADNLDVVAAMTNVRSQCSEDASKVYARVTFDVLARRSDTRGERSVAIPYFITALRGSSSVVSKRVGTVTVVFADGQERAQVSGAGSATIDRAEATLPEAIRQRIVRKRKAGEADAAIDPLSEPEVKAAIARASFEVLVGFQLDDSQIAYNATR